MGRITVHNLTIQANIPKKYLLDVRGVVGTIFILRGSVGIISIQDNFS